MQPQTAPGLYHLHACAAISYNNYYVRCVSFAVQVVSWQLTPMPSPPHKAVAFTPAEVIEEVKPNALPA
ncbi:MAG: hypothetical protein JO078_11125 [Candidatus Eremiobacteraeota bacterium]|nr:hypothetical protein [Candidatus Eremiobacteraeota bacterium]